MTVRDIVIIAFFAAFIAALGFIPAIPVSFIAVPISPQVLGVLLVGPLLGAKRGVCTILVIWVLVAAGLPILSGGRGGIGVFFGATAGYLVGWLFAVWLTGFLFQTFHNHMTPIRAILFLAIGNIGVIYFFGILWLKISTEASLSSLIISNLVFLPGDIGKIAVAYAIIRFVHKALPDFFQSG